MFRPDSRLIRFLTRVCDLLFLNIALVLCCCTVALSGAAVTALYTVTLKIVREQYCDPLKDFFRALRENFLPSSCAAVLLLVNVTLIATLREVLYAETLLVSPLVFVLLSIAAVLLTALLSYLFPLLARFENSFSNHLGNAARLALANLPVTFLITVVNLLPLLICVLIPAALGAVFAFWFLLGFAVEAWVNSFYLNRIFEGREGGRRRTRLPRPL